MAFITVSSAPLDHQALYCQLAEQAKGAGAIVTFTGLVRDFNHTGDIQGIELEHYPGMAESVFERLLAQATERFDLVASGVYHRVGKIDNYEPIVWVGAASAHRKAAFDATNFIMDVLKKDVPIWKKEWQQNSAKWVAVKETDLNAASQWMHNNK